MAFALAVITCLFVLFIAIGLVMVKIESIETWIHHNKRMNRRFQGFLDYDKPDPDYEEAMKELDKYLRDWAK